MTFSTALGARHSFRLVQSTSTKLRPYFPPFRHPRTARHFSTTPRWEAVIGQKLTDVGEGTKEVQIIQWFVEEGAKVNEWDKLCEVQSDKATVDIGALYSGVIKKLHFKADAIVQTGQALLDIEVEDEVAEKVEEEEQEEGEEQQDKEEEESPEKAVEEGEQAAEEGDTKAPKEKDVQSEPKETKPKPERKDTGKHSSLATPAVRGLLKEHNLDIEDIEGTGKDGRVLKEDVYKHLEGTSQPSGSPDSEIAKPALDSKQVETAQRLTPVQSQMFKSMTASLSIPHFLYSDTANITSLSAMRKSLNAKRNPDNVPKLSYLPFMIKAVSLALNKYPILNARLDLTAEKPQLKLRSNHNIGIAMDTPSGLLVPVIKSVNARTVLSIAIEIQRLSQLGQAGKLSSADLSGGTITVSNIGSIGGETVAPVIVEGQLAILGIGKVKTVPIFAADGESLVKAEMVGLSWSADHRVVDGATMARMAAVVQGYLEDPAATVLDMS